LNCLVFFVFFSVTEMDSLKVGSSTKSEKKKNL